MASPVGVLFAAASDPDAVLRNCVNVDQLEDLVAPGPLQHAQYICITSQICLHNMPDSVVQYVHLIVYNVVITPNYNLGSMTVVVTSCIIHVPSLCYRFSLYWGV